MLTNKYLNYIEKSYWQHYPKSSDLRPEFRKQEVQCLSHDGRMINFLPFEKIPSQINNLTTWLVDKEDQAKISDETLAHFLSVFWITFIAIHPFSDHNGKIAKHIMKLIGQDFGRNICFDRELDQFLIEGHPENDLENLKKLMLQELRNEQT